MEQQHDYDITWLFFLLGCVLFAFSRFFGLADFPIYFFCDEAFVGSESRQLIENGFRDELGRFFPVYYQKAMDRWVPQLTVYLSMPAVWLWPASVYALRSVTVVICLFGAVATCLSIRTIWPENRWWWLPIYFLCATPIWFLHSRLAFETTHAVAFYSSFLAGYLLYRFYDPRWIWLALASAVAAFYSHLSGSTLILFSVPFLALAQFQYHWQHVRILLPAIGVGIVCLSPCIYWLLTIPHATTLQLDALGSAWMKERSLWKAATSSFLRWISGLDPTFWFSEGPQNQLRHIWKGRSMIPLWSAPIIFIGIVTCFVNRRKLGAIVLLSALLISITPLLFVESHIMRAFYILAPLGFLVAFGADAISRWNRVSRLKHFPQALTVSALLGVQALTMTREALFEAPLWYPNYGLYGLQWGARELFGDALPKFLEDHPYEMVQPPGNWANGPQEFPRYFLSAEQQKRLRSVGFSVLNPAAGAVIPSDQTFILSMVERFKIERSRKYKTLKPILEVRQPNQKVGFTFTKLEFVDDRISVPAAELRLRTEVTPRKGP